MTFEILPAGRLVDSFGVNYTKLEFMAGEHGLGYNDFDFLWQREF